MSSAAVLNGTIGDGSRTKRPMDKTSHAIFDQVDQMSHIIFPG